MEISAAVLSAPKQEFKISTVSLDAELRPEEVLVKVVAVGLCHTDLAVKDGHLEFPLPGILGHEGAGIVEKIGSSVTKVKPGDHVVLAPASCGKCVFCKSGHPSYCELFFPLNFGGHRLDCTCVHHDHSGNQISGFFFGQSSFATYSLSSENNVVKVQQDIPLEMLGPLGCGLQTGSGAILNVLHPEAGESIVISGVGPVGAAAIMAAKASGCTTIIAVDVFDSRLEIAKNLGATHTINSKNVILSEEIQKNIHPGGVHYAVDTTGRSDVINQLLGSLRFFGKCVALGVSSAPTLEVDYSFFTMGRSLQYVVEGDSIPDIFIPQLIELYKSGDFPFDRIIKYYDFEDINQAVEDTQKGVTMKAILRMPA